MKGQDIKIAESIIAELKLSGTSLEITGKNSLRIKGVASKRQIQGIRLFKAELLAALSPQCANCGLPLDLIESKTTWFCRLGCTSQKVAVDSANTRPSPDRHPTYTATKSIGNNGLKPVGVGGDGRDGFCLTKSKEKEKEGIKRDIHHIEKIGERHTQPSPTPKSSAKAPVYKGENGDGSRNADRHRHTPEHPTVTTEAVSGR